MRFEDAKAIARAALYEGYLLYPYRASSVKNRKPWTFGCLASGASARAEVPLRAPAGALIAVKARFLEDKREREIALELPSGTAPSRAAFGGASAGTLELSAEPVEGGFWRVAAALSSGGREELASAHVILGCEGGRFQSVIDPAPDAAAAAASCRSQGLWPCLVGGTREAEVVLAAPIILGDDPQVAPESPGDLFDGTEIDEILSLRILTLSEEEKAQIRAGDPRARALLERTEALKPEDWARLHGARRS